MGKVLAHALLLCVLWGMAPAANAVDGTKRVTLFVGIAGQVPVAALRSQWLEWFAREGWIDKKNLSFRIVDVDDGSALDWEVRAQEIVRQRPDVICVPGTPWALMFQRLTKDIPIVFYSVADPVASKLVNSMSAPGGNMTGSTTHVIALSEKRIELLARLVPKAKLVAVTYTEGPTAQLLRQPIAAAAKRVGLDVVEILVPDNITAAEFVERVRKSGAHVLLEASARPDLDIAGIVSLLKFARIPAIWQGPATVRLGGLIGLGDPFLERGEHAARITAKILRGKRPAEIPVEQPNRWRMAVNVATAKAMGIQIPPEVMVSADEVFD